MSLAVQAANAVGRPTSLGSMESATSPSVTTASLPDVTVTAYDTHRAEHAESGYGQIPLAQWCV